MATEQDRFAAARAALNEPEQAAPPPDRFAAAKAALSNPASRRRPKTGAGNIDLSTRPVVRNADGTISTVRSASFNFDGREVLLPTVTDDGRVIDETTPEGKREIEETYRRTGKHLGVFKTPAEATAYAQQLHLDQEREYAAPPPARTPARVPTRGLDAKGLTGAEVKRRAAAGEPIVQEGPNTRPPTIREGLAAGVGDAMGGLARGLAMPIALVADVANLVVDQGGSLLPTAPSARVREHGLLPITETAEAGARDLTAKTREFLGGVPPEANVNEYAEVANRVAGELAVPIPELTVASGPLRASAAEMRAAERALRREQQALRAERSGGDVAALDTSELRASHMFEVRDEPSPRLAADDAAEAVRSKAGDSATPAPGTVRLYRAEPVDPTVDLPSRDLTSTPDVDAAARAEVRGSWYTADRNQAVGYKDDIQALGHDAQIRVVDVPASEVDGYLAARHPTASNYATDLESDYFVPPEARAGSVVEPAPVVASAADELDQQIGVLQDRAAKLFQQADQAADDATRARLEGEAYALSDESDALLAQRDGALVRDAAEAQRATRNIGPAGVRAAERPAPNVGDFVDEELARRQTVLDPPAELSDAAPPIDPARSSAGAAQIRGEGAPARNVGPRRASADATPAPPPEPPPPGTTHLAEPAGRLPPSSRAPRTLRDLIQSIREFIEDDWIRVKNLQRRPGVKVTEASDPYTAEILSHGRVGARIEEAKAIVNDIDQDVIRSARAANVPDAQFAADVEQYLHARHAPERNAHLGDRAAGISNAEAEATMQRIAALPHAREIQRVADRLQELNNRTLDTLLEGEVIDADLHELLRNRYQNHVPLNRIMDDTEDVGALIGARPLDVRSSGLRRARGSERQVSDITTNIVTNYEQAVVRAEKNRVDLATLKFARDNPQLDLFTEIRPRAIGERFAQEGVEQRPIILQEIHDPQVLTLREKGKPVYLRIEDPHLAAALRGVNRLKTDGVLRTIGAYTRWMSSLATRFNPEFFLPNKVRDIQEAMVYAASKNEIGAAGAMRTVRRDPQSVADVIAGLRGQNTPGARMYRQMQRDGGTTGGMGLSTRRAVELNVESIRRTNRSSPRRAARALVEGINNLNAVFEDSTRLSVYRTALERGASRDTAARLAKEASINFNKMGTGGPQVNALYMFANASIQGSAKMLRAMKNPKVAGSVGLAVGAAVASTAEWNDQIDPEWRTKVSKYDRLSGLPVVLPASKDGSFNYALIPVSWGIKPIKVTMDYAYDAMSGHGTTPGEAVAGSLSAAADAYNPVGGTDLLSAITPTILDLPVDIGRNREWSGGMIRPEWDRDALPSEKYFDDLAESATGRTAIGASERLSDRGIEISPADIAYAYESLVGGAGRFGSKIVNTTAAIGSGELPKMEDVPVASRFGRSVSPERVAARQEAIDEAAERKKEQEERAEDLRTERALRRGNAPMNQTPKDFPNAFTQEEQDNWPQIAAALDENTSWLLKESPLKVLPPHLRSTRRTTLGTVLPAYSRQLMGGAGGKYGAVPHANRSVTITDWIATHGGDTPPTITLVPYENRPLVLYHEYGHGMTADLPDEVLREWEDRFDKMLAPARVIREREYLESWLAREAAPSDDVDESSDAEAERYRKVIDMAGQVAGVLPLWLRTNTHKAPEARSPEVADFEESSGEALAEAFAWYIVAPKLLLKTDPGTYGWLAKNVFKGREYIRPK